MHDGGILFKSLGLGVYIAGTNPALHADGLGSILAHTM